MPAYQWRIPDRFNIGVDVADRQAPESLALVELEPSGKAREFTFGAISALSNRLANLLEARGLRRGDRVAVLLPQRHETAVAHVAAYKAGLVAGPLFTLFGGEAPEVRPGKRRARAGGTHQDQLPQP